jgi:hypothetical protein
MFAIAALLRDFGGSDQPVVFGGCRPGRKSKSRQRPSSSRLQTFELLVVRTPCTLGMSRIHPSFLAVLFRLQIPGQYAGLE